MRNMWQIIVGVVLAAGAAIALYDVVGDDSAAIVADRPATQESTPATTASAAGSDTGQAMPPTADADLGEIAIGANEFIIGEASAPVTIIEYASLTCPHCAQFHGQVLPGLKSDLIETGKVRLVYRDFPLDRYALAGSMLARCAGRERFFAFLDVMFRDQPRWARAEDPLEALSQIARLGGMGKEKFQSCMSDQNLQTEILEQRKEGTEKYQVNATPTLFINGKKYSGGLTLDQIKAVVSQITPKT